MAHPFAGWVRHSEDYYQLLTGTLTAIPIHTEQGWKKI